MIDASNRLAHLDDELDVLLFDPVDEWLLDPTDPSRSQLFSYQMLSSDIGIKLEESGCLIEEEMKRVKLEEEVVVEDGAERVNGVKDSAGFVDAEIGLVEAEVEDESKMVVGVKDISSSMATKDVVEVTLEEEKVGPEDSQKMGNVKETSSMEEKVSAEVKSEESSSSSDEESSSEEEEEESSDGESSSGASSSESSEESSDGEKEKGKGKVEVIEEGEILMESDEEEGEGGFKGSAKSIKEKEVLPPVPKIDVQLEPHHQTVPIGEILSILGDRVIVEGSVNHNPLNEGSILWVTHTRSPLGLVDEVFGPVKSPFYLIRYNSEEDIPAGLSVGTAVSFVSEFASYVLNNSKDVHQKGYDAGEDEIGDEVEFSDDEKEAEYKRALRQAKRGYNKSKEMQSGPVKSRRNVDSMKKNNDNFTPHFPLPVAQSQKNQFSQNQILQNQMQQNQFTQNQFQQNQFQQNQFQQNQFQQNQFSQNQFSQNQFQQNQQPPCQFPQNQMMQNQVPQNQMLQNQLLMSIIASGMQIPGFGLPMNTNPNQFLFGGMNFPPPSNMQFNPGNMQLNPGNMPSSVERPPMQGNSSVPNHHLNPVNNPFNGEQLPMQLQPGNLCMGAQGSNLQLSPGSSSFGGESPTMQFNPGHSGSLQFNPGNAMGEGAGHSDSLQFNPGNSRGDGSNLQFGRGNFSNRGGRPNQRGRGRGRYFAGRNGNARSRNG